MPQLNIYRDIHKGMRHVLAETSLQAGKTDWADERALGELAEAVAHLLHLLHLHVRNEEEYVHPLLAERVPGGQKGLEAEHRQQEEILDDLEAFFVRSRSAPANQRAALGLEFYRALNRFVARYLPHLEEEECRVMAALNDVCSPEEILARYLALVRSQPEEDLLDSINLMFPAMTTQEIAEVVAGGQAWMSPALMAKASQRAEQALGPARWQEVLARVGPLASPR